jgi:hypothetical protein
MYTSVMVFGHYSAGREHLQATVRERVCVQICEHLVIMPCDIYPLENLRWTFKFHIGQLSTKSAQAHQAGVAKWVK